MVVTYSFHQLVIRGAGSVDVYVSLILRLRMLENENIFEATKNNNNNNKKYFLFVFPLSNLNCTNKRCWHLTSTLSTTISSQEIHIDDSN